MVQDSPSRKQEQFIVRLPDGMRDRIKQAASDNNRSMNAEIVETLQEKYPPPASKLQEAIGELLELMRTPLDNPTDKDACHYKARVAELMATIEQERLAETISK